MAAYFGMFVGSLLDPIAWAVAYLIHLFMINKSPRAYFFFAVIFLTAARTAIAPRYENLPSAVLSDVLVFLLASCVMASVFAYLIKRHHEKRERTNENEPPKSHPIDDFDSKVGK